MPWTKDNLVEWDTIFQHVIYPSQRMSEECIFNSLFYFSDVFPFLWSHMYACGQVYLEATIISLKLDLEVMVRLLAWVL